MQQILKSIVNRLLRRNQYRRMESDDFILRLPSSVIGEGMLHPGNIYLMDLAIRQMPDEGCVLEIGSYGGLSANLMTYLLQMHHRRHPLFCCDAWVYEGYHDDAGRANQWMDGRNNVSRIDFMAHIKASFIQSCKLLSADRLPKALHLDSDAFFRDWSVGAEVEDVFGRNIKLGGPIAFAYVDGNHAYDFAKRDVENVLRYLLPGGYMLLDDSAKHQHFGSAKLAQELCKHPDLDLVLANPHYLFQKK